LEKKPWHADDTDHVMQAWEFRHPEFRADRKDNLDNIRRKAPAPRKPQQAEEAFPANQQIAVLSETLTANQHQIQALQEHFYSLAEANRMLVNQVMHLHKMVKAQNQASNEVITHLNNVDDRRRNSRHSAHSSHSSHSGPGGPTPFQHSGLGLLPDSADEPAVELRHAREMLNSVMPDPQAERQLERLSVAFHNTGSPPDSANSSVVYSQPGSATLSLVQDPLNDIRHMVYPVGQTSGIDPFHADHIHNIPYSRPLSNPNIISEPPSQITSPPSKERGDQLWGLKKPKILLVEDDKTCSKIGAKFLSLLDCTVDSAVRIP
jgi:osomolarity two-component system response regulator SKN7